LEGKFLYKNSTFHYSHYGQGGKPLIAFHGFGQNGQMFAPVQESLGGKYTVYSFDFAYHGRTRWSEPHGFTKNEFLQFMDAFMRVQRFRKISLLGFSMGGRVALSVIPDLAEKLEDVFLFAPDGIEERIYYRSFMAGKPGETIFREVLKHPKMLIAAADAFSKIGLTKKYVADYMKNYWADERKRDRLFNVWLSMRTYRARLHKIRVATEQRPFRIFVLWGKHDKMIPSRMALQFKRAVPKCELRMVEGGHFIVNEKLNHVIDELLNHD